MFGKCGLGVAVVLLVWFATSAEARTWHNKDGRTIEADFVSLKGDQLTLNRSGKEITFDVNLLDEEDQDHARAMALLGPGESGRPKPKPFPRSKGSNDPTKVDNANRTWTDNRGNRVFGKFASVLGNTVTIRKRDQQTVTFNYFELVEGDQRFIAKYLESKGQIDLIPKLANSNSPGPAPFANPSPTPLSPAPVAPPPSAVASVPPLPDANVPPPSIPKPEPASPSPLALPQQVPPEPATPVAPRDEANPFAPDPPVEKVRPEAISQPVAPPVAVVPSIQGSEPGPNEPFEEAKPDQTPGTDFFAMKGKQCPKCKTQVYTYRRGDVECPYCGNPWEQPLDTKPFDQAADTIFRTFGVIFLTAGFFAAWALRFMYWKKVFERR